MKKILTLIITFIIALGAFGCGNTQGDGIKTVHFLNWGDYIDPTVIPMFEEENPDIKISMTTVPSNEEMYVITSTQGTQIDIVVPSEYMVQRMIKETMLANIDTKNMENFKYVKDFASTLGYDPQAKHSIPYSWGTFGIMYNIALTGEEITSLDSLFDPKYKKQIMMYDSIRDSVGVALLQLGYDINTQNSKELEDAAQLLIDQKPLVLAYGTDDIRMSMVNGSAAVSLMYAGDAAYSMDENEDLRYVVPEEGANIFADSLCILRTTDVYKESMRFIDFLMRPDIAALNAEYTGYSTPNSDAAQYIDAEMLENNAFNPSPEDIVNTYYYEHLEKDVLRLYEDTWMKVKTAWGK